MNVCFRTQASTIIKFLLVRVRSLVEKSHLPPAHMAFGEGGLRILEDIRSEVFETYRYSEVKDLKNENEYLDAKMNEIRVEVTDDVSEELSVNYIMLKYFRERNQRILRSYHFHRLNLLLDLFFSKESVEHLLSAEEEEYFGTYDGMLKEYLRPFSAFDFITRSPPTQFFIQILTLEDCGLVMDEGTLVELKKDRIYFIKRSTVTHLINAGFVRII